MTEEEYAEFVEELTPEQKGWAALIRMGAKKEMTINLTAIIITAIICYTLYKMSRNKEEPGKNETAAGQDGRKGKISEWKRK